MWSRRIILGSALAFAGCGFTPVLGTDGAMRALQNATEIEAPDSIVGFRIKDALVRRLGVATEPAFALAVTYSQSVDAAAVSTGGDTTRLSIIGEFNWKLRRGGEVIAQGDVSSFTGYDATGSTVATQTAAEDARERLAVALADLILAEIALTLSAP